MGSMSSAHILQKSLLLEEQIRWMMHLASGAPLEKVILGKGLCLGLELREK